MIYSVTPGTRKITVRKLSNYSELLGSKFYTKCSGDVPSTVYKTHFESTIAL